MANENGDSYGWTRKNDGHNWFIIDAIGFSYHLACFLAQQSAEKGLKAFLYARGEGLVFGHSVAELCRRAASLDRELGTIRKKAATLDKYYIPTRYPNFRH
ncbi:MAG TPA: HEPN domain-containing protein [Methanophagales archaeon]|nr:HEPN domain-containing protein [Methanophagales archaeon]